jgi:hypothetical protein
MDSNRSRGPRLKGRFELLRVGNGLVLERIMMLRCNARS